MTPGDDPGHGAPGAPGAPSAITPFRIEVPESDLRDLRDRLRRTRWPDAETVDDWSQGVPLAYMRDLCRYWAESYDWRTVEARVNALPQIRVEIGGLGIHAVHLRSPHPAALPLVLTHGWPGSLLEFLKVAGPLVDPPAHGGDPADAFHLVVPSLPGYGFSDKPTSTGWGVERIADAWVELMRRLGYQRYGAAGSDWGTTISTLVGQRDPEHVAGIHLVPPLAPPDPATFDELTVTERAALADLERTRREESGYGEQQSTRPQTLGYGLVDSPAALCSWIVEKFRAWSDCAGHPENAFTRDEMLDGVTLYWLTASGASSVRLYWESLSDVAEVFAGTADTIEPVIVPAGCSIFPKEVPRVSRRWAARRFTDIRHWNELERGGHFAALEQPGLFVDELRAFFRLVR